MADGVFNIARGEVKAYCRRAAANDGQIAVVLLQRATLVADDLLVEYDDLATLLAGSCDEATFTNYSRRFVSGSDITIVVDDVGNFARVTLPRQQWDAAGGTTNNQIGKLLWTFKPTPTSPDSAIVPLLHYDYVMTTDGTTRPVSPNAAGSWRSP